MTNYNLLKFASINKHLIDSLVMGTLHFSKPDELNDPFDCKIDVERSLKTASDELKIIGDNTLNHIVDDPQTIDNFKKYMSDLGVCSFSTKDLTNEEQTLMWSHYAHKHQGVCLEYKITEVFLEKNNDSILGIAPVIYKENFLTKSLKTLSTKPIDEFFINLAKIFLITKSPPWIYEREMRIVTYKPRNLKIPNSFIRKVFFGLNTAKDDIKLIKKITLRYPNIKLYKAKKGNGDFGFGFTEID